MQPCAEPIAGKNAKQNAKHEANHHGLTKDTEPLLNVDRVCLQLVNPRNLVENPVAQQTNREEHSTRKSGKGDARQAAILLREGRAPVSNLDDYDCSDCRSKQSEEEVACRNVYKSASKREVPVVPNIDINRLSPLKRQHHKVNHKSEHDGKRSNHGSPGNCG